MRSVSGRLTLSAWPVCSMMKSRSDVSTTSSREEPGPDGWMVAGRRYGSAARMYAAISVQPSICIRSSFSLSLDR